VTERTLVLIKPDGVQRLLVGRILARFEERGLKLAGLKLVAADRALRFLPEWLEPPPPEVEPKIATVARAVYDEIDARFDDILVRHPGLAAGAHVSLLRLIEWPAVAPPA
jgi:hypothetical protein